MENKMESLELEEMRQQMMALKEQLEEQVHVNEDMMAKQLRRNTHNFSLYGCWMLILSVLGAYPMYVYCQMYGVSMACFWTTVLGMILDGVYAYYVTHMVNEKDMQQCNYKSIIEKLILIKRMTRITDIIEAVFLILCAAWLFYETFFGVIFRTFSAAAQTRVFIGFVAAILFGIYYCVKEYKIRNRKIDEMIRMMGLN